MPALTTSETEPKKYWAFISYSQRDKEWSGWLQRAIENYRVPRRFVGRASRDGAVPRRLFPVFRDREELPTSADLGSNIEQALRASRYLIVVCSPNAAASRWVNEEVRGFKAMGREDRVLAIIVDGEPNASDKADAGVPECFPQALRYRVGPDGLLTQERTEPIAADARPDRDGRSNARLRILAGLLGVGFDELRQRERVRRRRRRIWVAAAAALVLGALAGIWWIQERAKKREVDRELASKYEERARQLVDKGDVAGGAVFFAASNQLEPTRRRRDAALLQLQHLVLPRLEVQQGAKISVVAFDPAGERFLTLSDTGPDASKEPNPGLLRVWNAETGARLLDIRVDNDTYAFRRAFFTKDGHRIFTALENARLWDSRTGQPIAPPIPFAKLGDRRDPDTIERAALDPSEKNVILKWRDNLIQRWDAETSRPLGDPQPYAGAWSDLAFLWDDDPVSHFSPNGKIAIKRPDLIGPLQLLDAATGNPIGQALQQESDIEAAAFSSNGTDIVTGGVNGTAYLWYIRAGSEVLRSNNAMKHPAPVSNVKFSPNGEFVLTISGDTARLWNRLAELEMVMPTPDEIGGANFSTDGQRVVTGSKDGTALVWNIAQRRFGPRHISPPSWQRIRGAALSPDGRALFAQHYSNENVGPHAQLWDVEKQSELWKPIGQEAEIISAVFSPDGSVIASVDIGRDEISGSTRKKILRFWNAQSGAAIGPPFEIAGESGGDSEFPETILAFSPDSRRFLLVHNETIRPDQPGSGLHAQAALRIFDGRSGQPLGATLTVEGRIPSALILRSGDILLAREDRIVRWPNNESQPATEPFINAKRVLSMAVSPNENTLLAISRDSGQFWDLRTRQPIGTSLEKRGLTELHAASFSPDGRLAATVDGRVVRLWDPQTGEPVGASFVFGDNRSAGIELLFVEGGHLRVPGRDGVWDKDISWLLRDVSPKQIMTEAELFSRRRINPAGALEIIPAAEWAARAKTAAGK